MTRPEKGNEIRRLAKCAQNFDLQKTLDKQIGGANDLVLYGAGNYGRNMANYIKASGRYNVKCFLDRNAEKMPEYLGFPVYKPDDERLSADFRKDALVIFSLMLPFQKEYDEIEEKLCLLGYTKFANGNYFFGLGLSYDKESIVDRRQFAEEAEDIALAFDLMTDEHSQNVFLEIFKAHAEIKYDIPEQSPNMTQYVNVNIPFRYKYHSFVDVGAFTGDTLENLVEHYKLKQYIAFEPDMGSYAKLSLTAEKLCKNIDKVILFPMGLSDKHEFLRFSAHGSGSSKADESGEQITQTARLDDLLKGYDELMIKMDIEGAEISALNGAKQIITGTKPDLAICVYHRISDMWRIPLMLKDWVPEYSFYLRSHYSGTLETVLYTTVV
jgi:FkbM family methyltransferase